MSGNPFRATQQHQGTPPAAPKISFIGADAGRAEGSELGTDSVHSPLPTKKSKSVRIESPPTSPPHPDASDADDTLLQRIIQASHSSSLPPSSPAGFSDNFEDHAAYGGSSSYQNADEGEGGYAKQDSVRSSQQNPSMAGPTSPQTSPGVPVNPFAKTLATMEPSGKGTADQKEYSTDRPAAERTVSGNARASMDVAAFQRLLMTGNANPSVTGAISSPPVAPAPNPISASAIEGSNSTDTSSISRQSLFEPVQEPQAESPRTSFEMAASDDDERVGLVTESKKPEKKKPPPPKHRHGKLVTSRAPQTVSFSDFSPSVMAPPPQPSSSSPALSRNRADSDLNKPLPPTPPVVSPPAFPQDSSSEISIQPSTGESSIHSEASPGQKKAPPPVPLARRQSQLRSSAKTATGNRSRSNSSLTLSSQHSTELPLSSPGSMLEPTSNPQPQKAAPPPPPTRRHGAGTAASSSKTSSTDPPSTPSARRTTLSSPSGPTPPSSRRTTISSPPPSPAPAQDLARTSSQSSSRNPRSASDPSSGMPPPPPPPRRRQSGRASFDKEHPLPGASASSPTESRRTSMEIKRSSWEGKRRTSIASQSSLSREYTPSAENENALYSPREDIQEEPAILEQTETSVLDDMDQFQKEIDELRAKYPKS